MEQQSKQFLTELLSTPSPSGAEMEIQKKWISYVQQFADEIRTDMAGNAIGILNPKAPFKVLIAGHCDEIGFIVRRIDERGFIYVQALGGISPKAAVGLKVTIFGFGKTITGVVGVNAQHHGGVKDELTFEDIYIDCGAKNREEVEPFVQVGDLAVYKRELEWLMNNRISGRGLDNRTGAFIAAEVLRHAANQNPNVGLYVVSTVNEETNMGGAYFAGAGIEPTLAIAVDVTFATDYPGVDTRKHGDIKLEKGPVLAKGAPINNKINRLLEKSAKALDIKLQYELTPRHTGTDADKLRLTGKGVPVALVSLPLRYMHAPVETASLQDIEEEINLLTHFVVNLNGTESLNPLED